MRPLDAFVMLAQADGSFDFNDHFAGIVKLSRQEIVLSFPQVISSAEASEDVKFVVWVCVIALAYLEKSFKNEEDEWVLVADKTQKFIRKNIKGLNVQNLVAEAQRLLK